MLFGKIFALHAAQVKNYISLWPMLNKLSYFKIVFTACAIVLLALSAISQNNIDTTSSPIPLKISDSADSATDTLAIAIIDSTNLVQDSTSVDSTKLQKSKWDFLTTGGNDSTYYSFYGHLFNTEDTNIVEIWNYNKDIHEPVIHNYDSTLNYFHIYNPAFKKTINNGYLGNIGSAIQSNIFAEPNPKSEFIFIDAYTPYMFQANNLQYFNVLKPFTVFRVDIGPNEEQNLEIFHTQNINKYFNAFARFKNYTTKGSYIRQETRNNAGTFGTSYTKGRLATFANWTFNRVDVQESGGIVDMFMVIDSAVSTNEINMRLTDGATYIKNREILFDQKIGFLKTNVPDSSALGAYWFSLQYTYNRQKSSKEYRDSDDAYKNVNNEPLHLYANNYSGGATFDSTSFFYKNHNFRINLEENPRSYPFVGAYFGYGLQTNEYYFFNKDILFDNSHSSSLSSSYFETGIYRLKGEKFKFSGNYKIFISGYRQTDMQLDGFISQKFGSKEKGFVVKGEGNVFLQTPDYLLTNYYSNHYKWQNNFNAEKRTSLNFSLSFPYYQTQLGSRFNLLSDYIYFNTDALPEQYSNAFSVLDFYLNNILKFGPFGLNTRLNYQQTSNKEILPLPEFSGYAALYWAPSLFFKDTGGKLRFQLGTDAYYWTSYYGQAYSPALGRFYNQKEIPVGNYPFVGFFTNFEIKRLRFYLRYEHANYKITEPKNYFNTPYYPTNQSTFRYGLVWTFYD